MLWRYLIVFVCDPFIFQTTWVTLSQHGTLHITCFDRQTTTTTSTTTTTPSTFRETSDNLLNGHFTTLTSSRRPFRLLLGESIFCFSMENLKLFYYLGGLGGLNKKIDDWKHKSFFFSVQIWLKANLNSLFNQILVVKIYETKNYLSRRQWRQVTNYPN